MRTPFRRGAEKQLEAQPIEFAGTTESSHCERRSLRSRIHRFLSEDSRGNATVEMAFVAPIMMLMLTGLASFSMALYSYQQLGYAVSATAQQVGAEQGLLTDPCQTIESDVTTALPGWTPSKFTFTTVITDSTGSAHTFGPQAGSAFTCTSGANDMALNEPMTITVTYTYNWFSIFTWRPDNSFTPSGNLNVTESVLVE
jgi:Flp pilus assembly protein TadG